MILKIKDLLQDEVPQKKKKTIDILAAYAILKSYIKLKK